MTRTTIIPDAIVEAARWRLAALLLERPRAGWFDEIRALAREVDDPGLRAAVETAQDATEGDYLALLGPGGAVPAREVGYRAGRDPGWLLSDVARYYEAFAYRPRAEDPGDHLAVEAGFVGYLWLKEALARSAGEDDAADVTAAARRVFVAEHLAGVAQAFARTLLAAGDASHLAGAAAVVASLVPDARSPARPAADADSAPSRCSGPSPSFPCAEPSKPSRGPGSGVAP
jgi:hypothetical protein